MLEEAQHPVPRLAGLSRGGGEATGAHVERPDAFALHVLQHSVRDVPLSGADAARHWCNESEDPAAPETQAGQASAPPNMCVSEQLGDTERADGRDGGLGLHLSPGGINSPLLSSTNERHGGDRQEGRSRRRTQAG